MRNINDVIVEVLKEEQEYTDPINKYSQCILGVSISKVIICNPIFIARVVIKTNNLPYVGLPLWCQKKML